MNFRCNVPVAFGVWYLAHAVTHRVLPGAYYSIHIQHVHNKSKLDEIYLWVVSGTRSDTSFIIWCILLYTRNTWAITCNIPGMNYVGLGSIRSVFHPYSSVGNTSTFGIVEETGSNLTSNVSFMETLRVSTTKNLPGSPGIDPKRVGQRTAAHPKDPTV